MKVEIAVDVICDGALFDLRFTYDTGDLPPLQIGHRLEFELSEPAADFVIVLEGICWQHDGQSRRIIMDGGEVHGYIENILLMLEACPFVSNVTTRKERDL